MARTQVSAQAWHLILVQALPWIMAQPWPLYLVQPRPQGLTQVLSRDPLVGRTFPVSILGHQYLFSNQFHMRVPEEGFCLRVGRLNNPL